MKPDSWCETLLELKARASNPNSLSCFCWSCFFGDARWRAQLHYITFLMWFLPGGKWVSPMIPPLILSGIFFGRWRELHALRGKLRRACAESGIYRQLLGALLHQQGAEDPRFRQLCLGETYGIHPVSSTLLTKRVKKRVAVCGGTLPCRTFIVRYRAGVAGARPQKILNKLDGLILGITKAFFSQPWN